MKVRSCESEWWKIDPRIWLETSFPKWQTLLVKEGSSWTGFSTFRFPSASSLSTVRGLQSYHWVLRPCFFVILAPSPIWLFLFQLRTTTKSCYAHSLWFSTPSHWISALSALCLALECAGSLTILSLCHSRSFQAVISTLVLLWSTPDPWLPTISSWSNGPAHST